MFQLFNCIVTVSVFILLYLIVINVHWSCTETFLLLWPINFPTLVLKGLCSWSFWNVSRSSAVHGLRGAKARLQQIQESAFGGKAGESLTREPVAEWKHENCTSDSVVFLPCPSHPFPPSRPSPPRSPLSLYLCGQNALEYITMAALSKIFAVVTTYPYQVVRARLQDQHNRYDGAIDVVRRTWR